MGTAGTDRSLVVVGGGHNGLVAAILAADAGFAVTVLERADHLGGATQGVAVFSGHRAKLSRYSYLVSLFPDELARRVGIALPLKSRSVSSYTPVRRDGADLGLLVERKPGSATAESFAALTGSDAEFAAWQQFYGELSAVAGVLAPALTGPLRSRGEVRRAVLDAAGPRIWRDVFEEPIGAALTRRFADDTVRGVVGTDALIGTHASLWDESLLANRCFLYHLIGRGTGEWLVPVGGMGAVTDALIAAARRSGVRLRTGVTVTALHETRAAVTVIGHDADGTAVELETDRVAAAVAPGVVDGWLGRPTVPPRGAQLKINMLLTRLPRLASGVDPAIAFAGTTHLAEEFSALEAAWTTSSSGGIPTPLPSEVYCHSLTDPSIMAGETGATLTLFGLHTPAELFTDNAAAAKRQATDAALAALQRYLAEPLADCLAADADGAPCIDVATPLDLQDSLGMPGGHIFHGPLDWPFTTDEGAEVPDTAGTAGTSAAARRYGVAVAGSRRIVLAGAGSQRGGGVSGLGGAAAIDAVLADR